MRWFAKACGIACTLAALSTNGFAAPNVINYQGALTDGGGLPVDSTTSMTFKLFDAEADGGELWSETQSVPVQSGAYSVLLGSVNPFAPGLFDNDSLWLELTVAGEALAPRRLLTSVPYALRAASIAAGSQVIEPTSAASTGLVVRGEVAQTADLQQWQNSSGGQVASVGATGNLSIAGNLYLPPTTATTGSIRSGAYTLLHAFGTGNVFVGGAGNLSMSGQYNTASGSQALFLNTTGFANTATGVMALQNNSSGSNNVAIGVNALNKNIGGNYNGAFGNGAMFSNTTGNYNGAFGNGALYSNTEGSYNTAVGRSALLGNTTGYYNTALGDSAGYTAGLDNANATGIFNTFLGADSGPGVPTQIYNATAVGAHALVSASNSLVLGGTGATAVKVGIGTTTPTETLDVVGNLKVSGSVSAGSPIPASSLDLSSRVAKTGDTMTGMLNLPANGLAVGTSQLVVSGGNVGVGTASPSSKLVVAGDLRVNDDIIWLRTSPDTAHGLGFYGGSKLFGTYNPDGPVLFGSSGGALGTTGWGRGQQAVLKWDYNGNVTILGALSKGSGSFKIDHPLDPENKYLYHSFVESPDMMNIYNGNTVTDGQGYATVMLPEWFEALNKDFRYQLTVVDEEDTADFIQAKVVKGVSGNSFVIRTSGPLTKISWQVTGIRKDAFAQAHRIPVEEEKPENEKGRCLHPEACSH